MIDVQSSFDRRGISIDRVGVRKLRYPILVRQMVGGLQQTIADIAVYVDLHAEYRGTHMSRFVEIIDEASGSEITGYTLPDLLEKIRTSLHSHTAEIELRFPYFLRKAAPVSGKTGLMEYMCRFHGRLDGKMDFLYGITAPVTSLCPCSREISERGAHNQRGEVTIEVRSNGGELVWFEELIEMAERCASAPLYSLLKREDEKWVTEHAYDHPAFVEDMVRTLAEELQNEERVTWFRIAAENFESIHNHNAFALIEREKKEETAL